jgi:hypothetical protein
MLFQTIDSGAGPPLAADKIVKDQGFDPGKHPKEAVRPESETSREPNALRMLPKRNRDLLVRDTISH